MTSQHPATDPDIRVAGGGVPTCKRPGCGNLLPEPGRGRARQFCSNDCARRYHNNARVRPTTAAAGAGTPTDPLAALEAVIRQATTLTRAAREQTASLDPARVHAQIAEAEAARRRAEAAAVVAEA